MKLSKRSSLLSNIASLGAVQIVNYVFPLISVPIVSRIIGPDRFGAINYVAAIVGYFTLLISFGFDLTATRRISHDPQNITLRNKVFSEVFFAQLLLLTVSTLIFIICLNILPALNENHEIAIFTFFVCISSVLTQNWLFQAMQELKKIAILNLVGRIIFTIVVLIVVQRKSDYVWQPLINSLTQIIISVASFTWAYKRFQLHLTWVSFTSVTTLLKGESVIFFSMVVVNLYTVTNTVMLGAMTNTTEVGYYTAALRFLQIATAVINIPIAQAMFPYIGRAFGTNKLSGIVKVREIFPLVFWFLLLVCVSMHVIGPMLLTWFYGKSFLPSIAAFKVLSIVPVVVAINNLLGTQVMLNLKMDRAFFFITLIGAAIGLALNYFMVQLFGFVGTAWNWLIVETYITITMYIYLRCNNVNIISIDNFRVSKMVGQLKGFLSIRGKNSG